MLHSTKPIIFS